MSKMNLSVKAETTLLPLFSLVRAFSNIAGIQAKICRSNGHLLMDMPQAPAAGPCALLTAENGLSESCATSHAHAIEIAQSLRRPYIFTCYSRLAAWAIPIFCSQEPISFSVICGGALLIKPDAALAAHLREIAEEHNIDCESLVLSLDDLPVVSRDYFRAVAGFIFDLANIFSAKEIVDAPAAEPVEPTVFLPAERPQLSGYLPPKRRKEAKKEQVRRSLEMQTKNNEEEVVRLLREKRRDEAFSALLCLLKGDDLRGSATPRPDPAELFTRLFRALSTRRTDARIPEKEAALLRDALALRRGPERDKNLQRLAEDFVVIAEELVGGPRPRKVKAIQRYLENNLDRKLTLKTVGDKFGLKEKPLNALISKHYGMSFNDYVIVLRISKAKRLLETTSLTLGEIAGKTGFPDQSYFTKVFRATAGMTPSEYRRR